MSPHLASVAQTLVESEESALFSCFLAFELSILCKCFPEFVKKLGTTERSSKFGVDVTKTNVLIWRSSMSSSMKAAIHLGLNYTENLEVFKNTNFEEIQILFGITQKLIAKHSEENSCFFFFAQIGWLVPFFVVLNCRENPGGRSHD